LSSKRIQEHIILGVYFAFEITNEERIQRSVFHYTLNNYFSPKFPRIAYTFLKPAIIKRF
jgi:hypothetical protein